MQQCIGVFSSSFSRIALPEKIVRENIWLGTVGGRQDPSPSSCSWKKGLLRFITYTILLLFTKIWQHLSTTVSSYLEPKCDNTSAFYVSKDIYDILFSKQFYPLKDVSTGFILKLSPSWSGCKLIQLTRLDIKYLGLLGRNKDLGPINVIYWLFPLKKKSVRESFGILISWRKKSLDPLKATRKHCAD